MIRGLNIFAGAQRQYDEQAKKDVTHLSANEEPAVSEEKLKKVYKGKDFSSEFRNLAVPKEQMASQVQAEMDFSDRLEGLAQQDIGAGSGGATSTGVLPIQIHIPTSGQVYRFAKTIITPDDPLTMKVFYTQKWIVSLVKWIVLIFILFIIYLSRKNWSRG